MLLIVLDTVRARPLEPLRLSARPLRSLERLAKRGFLFDGGESDRVLDPPSHASIFTGRWPHELAVKWMTPLGGNDPTLAEYLGSHGYATAGFVANQLYCSYDTGLDRGFTHYEDYVLERLNPFRTARLVDLTLKTVADVGYPLSQFFGTGPFRQLHESLLDRLQEGDRKARSKDQSRIFRLVITIARAGPSFFRVSQLL